MAEDFGAKPDSPQNACLEGVRSSDLVVLILGERYGAVQGASGVSPTHEEFNEAKNRKPILLFVHEGVQREPQQAEFVHQVEEWQTGHYRAGFTSDDDLRDHVTRAISDFQRSQEAAPVDEQEVIARALSLLPPPKRNNQFYDSPLLSVAIAGGPVQRILRPVELESSALEETLQKEAMFGAHRLFDKTKGAPPSSIKGSSLVMQQDGGQRLQLDEKGNLLMQIPLSQKSRRDSPSMGFQAIIEEDVMHALSVAIAFADWVLEHIDPRHRLTDVVLATSLQAASHLSWRTQAEQEAQPNSGYMRMDAQDSERPIHIQRRRAALKFESAELAEDLMVPLRRQWKAGH
jgi:hypothetical protein